MLHAGGASWNPGMEGVQQPAYKTVLLPPPPQLLQSAPAHPHPLDSSKPLHYLSLLLRAPQHSAKCSCSSSSSGFIKASSLFKPSPSGSSAFSSSPIKSTSGVSSVGLFQALTSSSSICSSRNTA